MVSPLAEMLKIGGLSAGILIGYLKYMKDYQWKEVGTLSSIYIHPLKSGKSLSVDEVDCEARGPSRSGHRDREFMLYKPTSPPASYDPRKGNPKAVMLGLKFIGEKTWKMFVEGYGELQFNEPDIDDTDIKVKLWSFNVEGLDCGDEVAAWISTFLGDNVRLLKHRPGEDKRRPSEPKYRKLYPSTIKENCVPLFADISPYMVINESSFEDLNNRIPFEVGMSSFRPNFVVSSPNLNPWEEDNWTGELRIGQAVFTYNKPCERCNFTKVNPESGELYPENEPLRTLKSFRQIDKKHRLVRRALGDAPILGMHFSLVKNAKVRVGDKVYVRRTGPINFDDAFTTRKI